MKITSSTGALSVAPVGTDLTDADSWVNVGFTDAFSFEPAEPPEPLTLLETLRAARTLVAEAEFRPGPALDAFFGIPVVVSDLVPPSVRGIMFDAGHMRIFAPSAETRPFTDLEREGEWAKRTVRHGLADVLAWLNEDVGPEPDAAYTDHLMKTNFMAGIKADFL